MNWQLELAFVVTTHPKFVASTWVIENIFKMIYTTERQRADKEINNLKSIIKSTSLNYVWTESSNSLSITLKKSYINDFSRGSIMAASSSEHFILNLILLTTIQIVVLNRKMFKSLMISKKICQNLLVKLKILKQLFLQKTL